MIRARDQLWYCQLRAARFRRGHLSLAAVLILAVTLLATLAGLSPPLLQAQTPLSTDATLSLLRLTNVTLSPPFTSDTITYTARVVNARTSTSVLAATTHDNATKVIKLDGVTDTDGTVDLAEGDNIITVEVTAEDTTTMMTYTVTVTRAALVNICDRTPEVEAWILSSLSSGTDCAAVTEEQLAEIQAPLEISGYSSPSIVPGDFAGLTGLSSVTIRNSPDLTGVPENAFSRIPNLGQLYLPSNNISSVHEDAFNGLTALSRLSLYENDLTTLDAEIFNGLTALSFLELRFNNLTTLGEDIFDGLTALRSVYLGSNGLTTLDADIFDGLTALWLLDLSHNSLTTLDADIFDGLTALSNLDLADNGLTTLDADIFDGLAALSRLGLYENDLTTLDADIFDGLTALSSLSLYENSFTTLDADIFDGLTALSYLSLRDNSITTLPDGIFNDQTALGELNIQCNSLTELDLSRFDPFAGTLYYLDIRNNYFATPPSETAIREKLTSLSPTGLLTGDGAACTPRVTALPSPLTVAEGNSTTYTVELRTQPMGDVMVTISSDNTEVTVSPTTPLTFTATTWNTAQTVTVSAEQDADTVDDMVTLTHVPSGADYDSVNNTPLTVIVEDDDDPAVTVRFGVAGYSVAEGGSVTVAVELSADPEREVIIPLTATNQNGASNADYSGVPANVTFNSGATSETFTFRATQDTVDDDGESVLLGFDTLPTGVSAGTPSTSTVSITDDDDPAVTVRFGVAGYSVAEGGSVTVAVELSADPEREVIIPLTATNQNGASNADYSGVPANVTFNSGATSETFTFRATQDTVDDDGESVLLGFDTLPTGVSAGTPSTSTVSITDDDDPAVTVRFGVAGYSVAEGGSVTVAVELSADPEREVIIPLTATNQNGASNADYSGVPANVTFNSGATSETFTFRATQDTVDDDGESVLPGFDTLPTGVSAGTPSTSTVSITDDDDPAVTVRFGAWRDSTLRPRGAASP